VQGNVEILVLVQADEQVVDPGDVVLVAREGRAQHGGHADRVLVDVRLHVFGADRVLVLLQRDDPRLDVEVAAELLPDDVDVAAEDEVRPVDGLAGRLAPLAPLPLQGQGAEHDRLRRALCPGAGRLPGRVEQVGQHADAALLDLGRLRVLGVVDEVAVQVVGDEPAGLGLHPCGHEGRQIVLRVAVHEQLLADKPHCIHGCHPDIRKVLVRGLVDEVAVAVAGGDGLVDRRRARRLTTLRRGSRGHGSLSSLSGHCSPSDAQRLSGRAELAMGRACHVTVVPATPQPAPPG
jgi:hypothetical protein